MMTMAACAVSVLRRSIGDVAGDRCLFRQAGRARSDRRGGPQFIRWRRLLAPALTVLVERRPLWHCYREIAQVAMRAIVADDHPLCREAVRLLARRQTLQAAPRQRRRWRFGPRDLQNIGRNVSAAVDDQQVLLRLTTDAPNKEIGRDPRPCRDYDQAACGSDPEEDRRAQSIRGGVCRDPGRVDLSRGRRGRGRPGPLRYLSEAKAVSRVRSRMMNEIAAAAMT
jgi:hypothetical protein